MGGTVIQRGGCGTGVSGVAVDRGTRVRVCHGIDRALIKLKAVNIHCPNRSKQEGKRSSWRLWDIGTAKSPSRNMVSTGVFY